MRSVNNKIDIVNKIDKILFELNTTLTNKVKYHTNK